MKIKISEIRLICEGLRELPELPSKPAYWLARIFSKLNSEAKAFERVRMNLLTDHAKKDKNGELLFKKNDKGENTNEYDIANMNAFQKEFAQLIEEEFEIDFKPIKLVDLGNIKITPFTLLKLEKIINE
jgi:hypothetical protein